MLQKEMGEKQWFIKYAPRLCEKEKYLNGLVTPMVKVVLRNKIWRCQGWVGWAQGKKKWFKIGYQKFSQDEGI